MFSQLPSRSFRKKKRLVLVWFPHIPIPKEVSSNKLQKLTLHKTSKVDGTGSSHMFRIKLFLNGTITKRSLTTGVYVFQVSILTLCSDSSFVEILPPRISLPRSQECSSKIRIMSFPCPTWEPDFFCHLDDRNYSKFPWNIALIWHSNSLKKSIIWPLSYTWLWWGWNFHHSPTKGHPI